MMRQQLLDLKLTPRFDYGGWIRHSGTEAAQNRLALWMVHGGFLRLDSQTPAGKTHLLHALAQEHPQLGLIDTGQADAPHAGRQVQAWLRQLAGYAGWMVDMPPVPVPRIPAIALFHLLERAREMNRPVLIAWRGPKHAEPPPELASRLAAMECVRIFPPARDAELLAVLKSVAAARQWRIDDAVLRYLLTHLSRALPDLIAVLEDLEKSALSAHRRLTLAWAGKRIRAGRY